MAAGAVEISRWRDRMAPHPLEPNSKEMGLIGYHMTVIFCCPRTVHTH